MKKIVFALPLLLLLAACTTKEQDEQIKIFWMMQLMQAATNLSPNQMPVMNPTFPSQNLQSEQAEIQDFEAMMKEWEALQENLPADPAAPQTAAEITQPVQPVEQSAAQTAQPPQPAKVNPPAPHKRRNKAHQNSGQFMEIMVEDPSGAIKGKAPLKDRRAMQRAIDQVLQDNQNTLQDIGQVFGAETQAQAFALMTQTEKELRQQAKASPSLQEYLKVQRQLLKKQEQNLNQLMRSSTHALRNIH